MDDDEFSGFSFVASDVAGYLENTQTHDEITLMSITEDDEYFPWPFKQGKLPMHIILQIISYFTIQDIGLASRVSKNWNEFIWNNVTKIDLSTIPPDLFKNYWKTCMGPTIQKPKRLIHLCMNAEASDECFNVLPTIQSVDTLDLRNCHHLSSKTLKILAGIKKSTGSTVKPRKKDVQQNNTNRCFKFPHLQILILSDCYGITDDGIEYLLGYDHLSELFLANTSINGSCFSIISQLKQLWRLDLQGVVKLKDSALEKLAELPNLRVLELAGCTGLTSNGVESLRTKLEHLEVLTWNEESNSSLNPENKAKKRRLLKLGLTISLRKPGIQRKDKLSPSPTIDQHPSIFQNHNHNHTHVNTSKDSSPLTQPNTNDETASHHHHHHHHHHPLHLHHHHHHHCTDEDYFDSKIQIKPKTSKTRQKKHKRQLKESLSCDSSTHSSIMNMYQKKEEEIPKIRDTTFISPRMAYKKHRRRSKEKEKSEDKTKTKSIPKAVRAETINVISSKTTKSKQQIEDTIEKFRSRRATSQLISGKDNSPRGQLFSLSPRTDLQDQRTEKAQMLMFLDASSKPNLDVASLLADLGRKTNHIADARAFETSAKIGDKKIRSKATRSSNIPINHMTFNDIIRSNELTSSEDNIGFYVQNQHHHHNDNNNIGNNSSPLLESASIIDPLKDFTVDNIKFDAKKETKTKEK